MEEQTERIAQWRARDKAVKSFEVLYAMLCSDCLPHLVKAVTPPPQ